MAAQSGAAAQRPQAHLEASVRVNIDSPEEHLPSATP
jgi:hypothetical protein